MRGPRWTGWRLYAPVALAAVVLLACRQPDILSNPQFLAEDGALWYARAHNDGVVAVLTIVYAGYLQLLASATAAVACALPLRWAPALFVLVAVAAEILPVLMLVSDRCSEIAPLRTRLLLALLYLALPNTSGLVGVATYAYWPLSLAAFLVLVAREPAGLAGRLFDAAVLATTGVSGPLGMLLLPIAAAEWLRRRGRREAIALAILAATSAIQLAVLIATGAADRGGAPRGASAVALCKIVIGQLVYGLLLGQQGFVALSAATPKLLDYRLAAFCTAAIAALVGCAILRGTRPLRLFLAYAGAVFCATLVTAQVATGTQWEALTYPGNGSRYFLVPMLALVATFVWMAGLAWRPARIAGIGLVLATSVLGVANDLRHPPYVDYEFDRYMREYEYAPAGATVQIPVNPPGVVMRLNKT
jgi:hypothetical protein